MASITSVISLFVLLLATYCYAVPIEFTTDKPMFGHDGTHMFVENTTFGHMMTGGKKVREERESGSEEHTTDFLIKRDDESEMKRTFEHFTVPSVDLTTEMRGLRNMEESEETDETRSMKDMTFSPVNPTTEMENIRDIDEHTNEQDDESSNKRTVEDFSFPTSTSDSVEDKEETRVFKEVEGTKITTERLPHHAGEFEHGLFTTLESSTEFSDRAVRGSPEWFEREARASPEWFERSVRASPEWFERSARNYAEPEVEESKEEKVLPIKHISLDKTKTFEPSSSVDSYAKTTGLLHDEIKPIVTEVKEIRPVEDTYTHVEKIVPGTFHETKLLHEEMPHKEIHVNDYETKVFHEVPHKDLLVKDYETKVFHDDMPHKHLLVKDYETVKPALDEVKVKTVFTEKKSSY